VKPEQVDEFTKIGTTSLRIEEMQYMPVAVESKKTFMMKKLLLRSK
jgi:hypothetical protein